MYLGELFNSVGIILAQVILLCSNREREVPHYRWEAFCTFFRAVIPEQISFPMDYYYSEGLTLEIDVPAQEDKAQACQCFISDVGKCNKMQ